MAFPVKGWTDEDNPLGPPSAPTTSTWDAAAAADMETRLSNFTAAAVGVYRELLPTAGQATTAAGSGTKYALVPGVANASAVSAIGAPQAMPFLFGLVATEHAVANLTTKLRIKGRASAGGSNPNITATIGLYPVTISAGNYALGTVAGTTVAVVVNGTNAFFTNQTADFNVVADDVYCLGYTLSGTPSANFNLQARLTVRNV